MFSKNKIEIFLELDALFGFYAGVEEKFEENDFLLIFSDFLHFNDSFI